MMRSALTCLAILASSTGCTSLSLERHTVNQVATITDTRFREVLNNLAATAANPGVLPSYAPIGDGVATVGDTFTFDAKTALQRATFKGFNSETIGLMGAFNPQPQWTIDPVATSEQLEALQAAMKWVVCGPAPADSGAKARLDKFQVTKTLQALPHGWLCFGGRKDVPHHAIYSGHCKDVWVWVTPAGMEGLSRFTLVVQDIATVDVTSLTPEQPNLTLKIKRLGKDGKDTSDSTTIEATIKNEVRPLIVRGKDGEPRNQIKEIIASAPPGLDLKEKNERFILPADYTLLTTQLPNIDLEDPNNLPAGTPPGRTPSSFQLHPAQQRNINR
jgi:hypothetical protein